MDRCMKCSSLKISSAGNGVFLCCRCRNGMTNFIFTNRFEIHNPQAVNRAIKRIADTHNAEEEVEARKEERTYNAAQVFMSHFINICLRFCGERNQCKSYSRSNGNARCQHNHEHLCGGNPEVTREALEKTAQEHGCI